MMKQAVLDLCHQAYRSLKSYHGTTEVESASDWPVGDGVPLPPGLSKPPAELRSCSSADIWYASPNQLRVQGQMSRFEWEADDDPFELVCNATGAWSRWSCSEQLWEKEESVSLAIAGFTGVSGRACHTIPSILLGEELNWACKCPDLKAEDVEEAGHPAWRVHIPTDIGEVTYWVDKASGLLLRTHSFTDNVRLRESTARMLQRAAERGVTIHRYESPDDDAIEGPLTTDTTETFKVISINEYLPASLFSRPDGAPE